MLLGASDALPQPAASTAAAAATLTFAPVADATVKQANPTSNFGGSTKLSILGGATGAMHSYLKFTVSGVSDPSTVSSVTLRLYVTDPSVDGGKVFSVSNSWLESGKGKITWNNAPLPAAGAAPLAPPAGAVATGKWVSFSLPVSTFGANGTYSVMLASDSTSDSAGYASRDTLTAAKRPQLVLTLTSLPPPTAAFNADKTSGDAPLTVTFTDASTGAPTSWAWNFGDQTTSNVQNPPAHTYSAAGDYTVTLTASNAGGSSSAQKTIHVTAPAVPVADFAWAPNYLAVTFTDGSTNNPTAWAWDFGDGYTSVQQNPIHTYAKEGTYNVTLTATNGAGASAPVSQSVTVTAPPPPTASFTVDKSSGLVPLTVSFTDTSSGSPTSWQWDFGDNTGSTQHNPRHTYNSEGTFTVMLTASNAGGSTTAQKTITVTAPPPPTASFTADKSSGDAPLTVAFTDTSTGNPTSWLWDFGDGTPSSTSTLENPTYQYLNPGTYTVTLVAINAGGPSDPVTTTITVTGSPPPPPPPPTATFNADKTSGGAPLTVSFTDASTGNPTSWQWDFGDNTSSMDQNVGHTFAAPGFYTVTLTVTNSGGSSSQQLLITVGAPDGSPDPVHCTGYPEPRVFLESQSWWQDSSQGFPGRHVHLGTCFPLMQVVTGIVHFDLHIQLHNQPGTVNLVRIQVFDDGADPTWKKDITLSCQTMQCDWWVPADVDTSLLPYDGRREVRMTANIPLTRTGGHQFETTRWAMIIANGKPLQDYGTGRFGAAGWYTGSDYSNVFVTETEGLAFVYQPQSGSVTLHIKFEKPNGFVSIDPAFHAMPTPNLGRVLYDGPGSGTYAITIDTTKLSDGPHKLFMRTDDPNVIDPPGTASGILVLPFTVQNTP